jgi:hypothetical protein
MSEFLSLLDITWAGTTTLEFALLASLVWRKACRTYPFFALYVASTILQSAALFVLYRKPGLAAPTVWTIAWGTQGVVTVTRSLALIELARKVLARYTGIWALARRIVLWVGAGVVAYGLALSKGQYQWMVMGGVRGLELAMAAVIVTMLLFARYYRVPVKPFARAIAVGLCLYSSFYVVDYTLLKHVLQRYAEFWNFLGIMTFLASLLIWLHASGRYSFQEEESLPAAISPEIYGALSSEINLRLYLLNRQLERLMQMKERRP